MIQSADRRGRRPGWLPDGLFGGGQQHPERMHGGGVQDVLAIAREVVILDLVSGGGVDGNEHRAGRSAFGRAGPAHTRRGHGQLGTGQLRYTPGHLLGARRGDDRSRIDAQNLVFHVIRVGDHPAGASGPIWARVCGRVG